MSTLVLQILWAFKPPTESLVDSALCLTATDSSSSSGHSQSKGPAPEPDKILQRLLERKKYTHLKKIWKKTVPFKWNYKKQKSESVAMFRSTIWSYLRKGLNPNKLRKLPFPKLGKENVTCIHLRLPVIMDS